MKHILQFLLLVGTVLAAGSLYGQYEPLPGEAPAAAAALTPEMLQFLETAVPLTPQLRAARNALADHSVRSLTVNPDVELGTDSFFTKEISAPGSIADQKDSGRCWLFAGLNALRPGVIARNKMKDFMLSQAYEQFYQELEAANRSLELAIALRTEPIHSRRMDTLLKNLINDGGNWNYVRALIRKYGAVPEAVMPDDYAAAHTDEMAALLATRLRKAVAEMRQPAHDHADVAELRQVKMAALQDVYKILVLCLGKPPTSFEWRYETKKGKLSSLETYTPQSFRKKFLDEDLDRYVSFANYPGQPMHARLEWAWERNLADQPNCEAVNIEMSEMEAMTLKSIMADQPVWFAANAAAEHDKAKGLWLQDVEDKADLFGMDFSMTKADTLAYDNGLPNHAMVFTGVDVRQGVPVKWKVENSWGKKAGDKGWFIIDREWFGKHVYQVIIDKRFVPPDLLKLADQKPVLLPPWDPFTDWNQKQEP
ncbi:MAG TPA: C1 family peptidase [Dongiaceae bacterium]|jgi:bleomycin hydrolase|nr:C1 family peptidase [Dongiaceae bacterium]